MEKLKIKSEALSIVDIEKISRLINEGGVVILPTDTVYGLSAVASNKKSIERIYSIKKRKKQKPLIVLMKSFCMIRKYCRLNKKQYDYLREALKKREAISVVLRIKNNILKHLANESGGLAVRIPIRSDFLIRLIKKIDEPIVSTSLNLSGEDEILDLKNISEKLDEKNIDLVLDIGKIKKRKTSKIIDITDMNRIKLIRG